MSVLTSPLVLAVTVIFAQGCHCTKGCQSVQGTPCTANSQGQACMDDWFGKYCQIQNIAFGKTADQSSTYNDGVTQYNAALAVDGNNDTNFNAKSCSITIGGGSASWHVILDAKLIYNISRIRIYLRDDNIDQWHDNDMDVMVSGQLCQHFERSSYVIGETLKDNPLDVTCSPPIRGRNVTIAMNASFLSLCEVQVFVCGDGWFGNDCEHQCQCRNLSEVCDKQSGFCTSGCAVGRYGDGCLECVQGFYGPSCTKCGRCKNSDACYIHNGTCLGGCESGYLKPTCLQECQHGTYGEDCLQVCGACSTGVTCNHTSGVCETGCLPHHQEPYCKVCHDSWFGTNCTKKCKCNNITEVCDKANGNCRSGCLAGKRGSGCQDDCASGQYGFNCSFTCGHCYDVASCRIDDGNCTRGCKVGYSPPLCKGTASLLKNENSGHKTDVRFIIVCYLMVVLGAYSAAATTLVFRLKQKVAKTNAELEKQYVSLEPRGDSSVYDVIAGAHTYCNDVQPEDSDYENTTRNIMKCGEHSL